MAITVPEQCQELGERLRTMFAAAQVTLDIFGQVGASLYVVLSNEAYEMEWREHEGFGVTHVTPDKYWTRGSDTGLDKFAEAEQYLVAKLLEIA